MQFHALMCKSVQLVKRLLATVAVSSMVGFQLIGLSPPMGDSCRMDELLLRPGETDEASGNLPAARQAKLVELVRKRGQVAASELVTLFGVSRDTIRRDLTLLEERGLLVRTHGGAIPGEHLVTSITPLDSRMMKHKTAKERMSRVAAGLIRDGETLMLNGGSSITYFASELVDRRDLTIVTNNLRVLSALPERCLRTVYVLGGTYLDSSQVMVGFAGFAAMPQISVDTAIIGIGGISARGCSIGKLEEALATKEMMSGVWPHHPARGQQQVRCSGLRVGGDLRTRGIPGHRHPPHGIPGGGP